MERRDTATQVERELQRRFPLLSVDTDVRRNKDNKTLREVITHDKKTAKEEGRKRGSSYWKKLGEEWTAETSPSSERHVNDNTEPVAEGGELLRLQDVKTQKGEGKAITLDDIAQFNIFSWLLTPESQAEAKALVAEIHAQVMVAGSVAGRPGSSGASSSKRHKKAQVWTVEEDVLAMFD